MSEPPTGASDAIPRGAKARRWAWVPIALGVILALQLCSPPSAEPTAQPGHTERARETKPADLRPAEASEQN